MRLHARAAPRGLRTWHEARLDTTLPLKAVCISSAASASKLASRWRRRLASASRISASARAAVRATGCRPSAAGGRHLDGGILCILQPLTMLSARGFDLLKLPKGSSSTLADAILEYPLAQRVHLRAKQALPSSVKLRRI